MDTPQPIQQPVEEQLVAQWNQPAPAGRLSNAAGSRQIYLLAGVVTVLLIAIAIWQHDLNYGLAALVVILATVAVQTQNKRSGDLEITITNMRVVVGKHSYPYSELNGYWLIHDSGFVAITLEGKKAGLLPPTFLADTESLEDVRTMLSPFLAELEPRERKLSDQVASYFRL